MKKRFISIALIAVLALSVLAGCGNSTKQAESASADNDLLSQIKERGTIIIAMEGTWAPWTYHDENDELVGYDVEVAKAIAEKLGVEAEFVEGEWDGLLAGLDAGRYDIMVNGVTITDERKEAYSFTQPYGYNKTAVIVRSDNTDINSMEDLNGKNTANTISSTYAEVAESYGANVTGVDDLNQTIELLLTNRIDATLNDEVVFYDYIKAQPDAEIKIACYDSEMTSVGIPMKKDASTETLVAAVDEALAELLADGTISEISMKYFGIDISSAE